VAKRFTSDFTGKDVFLAVTMLGIVAIVLVFGNKSTYLRSNAFTQTATGVRIEAEEMTHSGNVFIDSAKGLIQF